MESRDVDRAVELGCGCVALIIHFIVVLLFVMAIQMVVSLSWPTQEMWGFAIEVAVSATFITAFFMGGAMMHG